MANQQDAESREEEWLESWTPLAIDYGEYDPLRAGSIDGTDATPHDRGIVRAMVAKCEERAVRRAKSHCDPHSSPVDKPPKNLESDPERTLFVGRLNHDTTEGKARCLCAILTGAPCPPSQTLCEPSSPSVAR